MGETKGGCRIIKELENDFEKACLFEKPIENLEEYINKVKKIRDKANTFLSFVEKRYIECPLCGKRYWIFDYDIYKKDVLNKEILYARCPQDHIIRLGNNKYVGWKGEKLEGFQIDWFIERMKWRCEEWS